MTRAVFRLFIYFQMALASGKTAMGLLPDGAHLGWRLALLALGMWGGYCIAAVGMACTHNAHSAQNER
jgi:hypothetical protein